MKIEDGVKKLLSGFADDKLGVIERRTRGHLASLLGVSVTPESLKYIAFDIMGKRSGRIRQGGMTSYTREDLSIVFPDSDFSEYTLEVDNFKQKDDEELYKPRKRSARFL